MPNVTADTTARAVNCSSKGCRSYPHPSPPPPTPTSTHTTLLPSGPDMHWCRPPPVGVVGVVALLPIPETLIPQTLRLPPREPCRLNRPHLHPSPIPRLHPLHRLPSYPSHHHHSLVEKRVAMLVHPRPRRGGDRRRHSLGRVAAHAGDKDEQAEEEGAGDSGADNDADEPAGGEGGAAAAVVGGAGGRVLASGGGRGGR